MVVVKNKEAQRQKFESDFRKNPGPNLGVGHANL